jgi:hypothetical protein
MILLRKVADLIYPRINSHSIKAAILWKLPSLMGHVSSDWWTRTIRDVRGAFEAMIRSVQFEYLFLSFAQPRSICWLFFQDILKSRLVSWNFKLEPANAIHHIHIHYSISTRRRWITIKAPNKIKWHIAHVQYLISQLGSPSCTYHL